MCHSELRLCVCLWNRICEASASRLRTVPCTVSSCALQVRKLSLQGNDLSDANFAMLLRGLGGLGAVESFNVARNKLTRASAELLTDLVTRNKAKQVLARLCLVL